MKIDISAYPFHEIPERFTSDELLMSLSTRHRLVAWMLAHGHTHQNIGDTLGISPKTIDTHRLSVMKRLGIKTNVELAHLAIARGWIVPVHPPTLVGRAQLIAYANQAIASVE